MSVVKIFVCSHRRPVVRDLDGTWKHVIEMGSPPFYRQGQTGSKCEASVYTHDVKIGTSYVNMITDKEPEPDV